MKPQNKEQGSRGEKFEGEGRLLRIYVGENDRYEGRPLYEAIVHTARAKGIIGATALRGILGYGENSRIHTSKILRLAENLPIVVEVVDRKEQIDAILPLLDKMIGREGLITTEKVDIIGYHG